MRENYRNSIASIEKFPQFTTMHVIDGQAGLIICASLIFYSLTIDNILNIIVLLILAGISIQMLTGENAILSQAGRARDLTGQKDIEERIQLAYMAAISNELGDTTKDTFEDKLKKEFGEDNVTDLEDDLSKVKINGKEYETGVSGGRVDTTTKIADKKPTSGETVTALSDKDTTPLKDDLGNIVKVPKGFGIAEDSGIRVEEGIVIEDVSHTDTKGSQFVWVPVGTGIKLSKTISVSGTVDIPLGRYTFDASTGTATPVQTQLGTKYTATTASSVIENYFYEFKDDAESQIVKSETYANAKAKSISEFVESALSNGGYYIARYEAGISGTTDNARLKTRTEIDGTVKPQSKSGLGVWNSITQPEAVTVCQSMYNTTRDKVTSDLVNSYAWDTAILFIQKCGNNGDDSSKYSIQRGRSSINIFKIQLTGKNKLNNQPGGFNERSIAIFDTQCKICDMAGNAREWTTETYSYLSSPGVVRGDDYFSNGKNGTASREGNGATVIRNDYGFRPVLYL